MGATRSVVRDLQKQQILRQLGEAAWRVNHGALADLPNAVIGEVREALSSLNGSLAVAHLAANRPEPRWPVSRAEPQPRQGWEHEAETSLLHDQDV